MRVVAPGGGLSVDSESKSMSSLASVVFFVAAGGVSSAKVDPTSRSSLACDSKTMTRERFAARGTGLSLESVSKINFLPRLRGPLGMGVLESASTMVSCVAT